jgi:hypothetical protein
MSEQRLITRRDQSACLEDTVFVAAHDDFVCVRQHVEEGAGTGAAVGDIEMATDVANCG